MFVLFGYHLAAELENSVVKKIMTIVQILSFAKHYGSNFIEKGPERTWVV